MRGLRASVLACLRVVGGAVPEGGLKNRTRAFLLSLRKALPRELMAGAGDTVVQVGMWRRANLERLARCVGRAGRVILVEADPKVAAQAESWIEESELANLTVVSKGAGKTRGRKEFLVGTSSGYSRLKDSDARMVTEVGGNAFETTVEIEVDTIDNILGELGVESVDYVEITVNGLELQVLEGMTRTLPRTRRLFLSGYARTAEGEVPTNIGLRDFLQEHGFRTKISRKSHPKGVFQTEQHAIEWGPLDGHVFAWRG